MKKRQRLQILMIFFLSVFPFYSVLKAQANWEIGMRFGDNIAVDATLPIGLSPRFHPSLYITDRFGLGGYFDWMFALSDGPTGLKFYPGLGPEFFFEHDFAFHIAGNFGAEYSFNFPLTVGFDWRPGFAVTESFKWKSSNWGITARFRLGQAKLVRADQ